ncbi:MAG: lipopolysaccharide biosynthesis protein [Butyrivibrio sp.]
MKEIIRDKLNKLKRTGFFHVFVGSVVNKIISFMSSVILVRLLTKSEYGVFTYAWNIYSIVLLVNGMGIESGALQIASEHGDDSSYINKIIKFSSKFGMLFDVLLIIILLCVGIFVPMPIGDANKILVLTCLLPVFQLLYNLTIVSLRVQKKNREFAFLSVVNSILTLLMSVVGAIYFRANGLILGHYISLSVSVLIALKLLKVIVYRCEGEIERNEKKAILKVSAISMCNNALSQLLYLLDVFVIGVIVADESVLASYKIATTIPIALSFIPTACVTYVYPYFAEHRQDGKWCLRHFKQIVLGMGVLNGIISTILFIFAPFVIKVFFGAKYLDAVPVFRVLSINYFLSGTFRIIPGNLLVTQRKLTYNLLVSVISGIVNILSDVIFIRWLGSMGAALATVLVVMISGIMNTSYLIYTFKKNS